MDKFKSFDKFIGYDNIKSEMYKLCDIITNPQKYVELGAKIPKGLLIHGEPGLGKTLLANCFIKACGINCFTCRNFEDGEDTIKSIVQTFKKAKENTPSIVFLDDMDKFSDEERNNSNAQEYVAIQTCIDSVKDSDVFVVATANDIGFFPKSLLRAGRFDEKIEIFLPSENDSRKIIKYYLSQKKYVDNLDFDEIAKLLSKRSCAQLESVINEAGVIAGYANKKYIETIDIINASLKTIFKLDMDKTSFESSNDIFNDEGEYKHQYKVALHEAGHAVVAEILKPGCVNLLAINSQWLKNGLTLCYFSTEYKKTIKRIKNDVLISLGGKAATEVVLAETDIGCTSDIYSAMRDTERLTDCFAEIGFDKVQYNRKDINLKNQMVDNCVAVQTELNYAKVKKLLLKNIDLLKQIALELFCKKLLLRADIQRIKNNFKIINFEEV